MLRLHLDYERAWATLGQALNNAGVEVVESDQETGVYHVRISEDIFTGEETGFLSGLWPFGKGEGQLLQISIAFEDENSFIVSVQDLESETIDREVVQQVLVLLREYAS